MNSILLKWLKKILSDWHGAMISAIVGILIVGYKIETVRDLYTKTLCLLKHILTIPISLWIPMVAILLVFLYTYAKMKRNRSFFHEKLEALSSKPDEVTIRSRKQKNDAEKLAYSEISERLATLRLFQPSLAGFDDWVLDFKKDLFGTNDNRKTREEIINDFQKSLDDYNLTINKYSVSIQENIFESLKSILKIFERELSSLKTIGTMVENKDNREMFYERIESYRTINAKTEEAQKMIRKRIEEIS